MLQDFSKASSGAGLPQARTAAPPREKHDGRVRSERRATLYINPETVGTFLYVICRIADGQAIVDKRISCQSFPELKYILGKVADVLRAFVKKVAIDSMSGGSAPDFEWRHSAPCHSLVSAIDAGFRILNLISQLAVTAGPIPQCYLHRH